MSKTIHLLSEHVINQIAAGEVIENPASVVKELVENSLDAGASKIIVEILGGGLQMIRVSDDGKGMSEEDALLCLERHATSKIATSEDLEKIATMGFRGEALASIASISKMKVQTAQGLLGVEVSIEGGVIQGINPHPRVQGTTIEVNQLFYNVPARRKFQKSPAICLNEVTKALTHLSLANPLVLFELHQNGKEILKLYKESGDFLDVLKKRAEKVLGEFFLEEAFEIESSFSSFSFRGILGGLQNTRPNRALQYTFINKRPVLCPAVSYAIKDAFGTRIEPSRFPIYIFHVDIPFEYLDVNVHPQKKEIRLREEKWIQRKIQEKIQELLFAREGGSPLAKEPSSFSLFSMESFFKKPQEEKPLEEELLERKELDLFIEAPSLLPERTLEVIGLFDHFLWIDASSIESLNLGISLEGILLVDLRKAGAKVLFEALLKEKEVSSQTLLLPLSFSCLPDEVSKICSEIPFLEKMGFSLRQSGKHSFLIEAIPPFFKEGEVVKFVLDFISDLEGDQIARERRLAKSCHKLFALRKEVYSISSALEIVYALAKGKTPFFCPLGNKTMIRWGRNELEQLFKK